MTGQKAIAWLVLLVLPPGFAGIAGLQHAIDLQRAGLRQEQDELALRSSKLIKAMSLEFAPLLADMYWTRAVQYYGDKRARGDPHFESLWPLLDIATTLDPNLPIVYRFGATFLSEPAPAGAGRPDLAVELLERGIRANPEYWRFYEDLGFIYYLEMKDYRKASEAFLEGSKNPDAQIWMKVMAAKIAAEGESVGTSIFLWEEIYNSTKDPSIRTNAKRHLQLLKVQQDCRQIDALDDEFEERFGRRPTHVDELVEGGLLRKVPADPLGYIYVLGEDGKAELSLDSPLLEQQAMLERRKATAPPKGNL
jgi:tetratricopeptide (TPR) repeat protein